MSTTTVVTCNAVVEAASGRSVTDAIAHAIHEAIVEQFDCNAAETQYEMTVDVLGTPSPKLHPASLLVTYSVLEFLLRGISPGRHAKIHPYGLRRVEDGAMRFTATIWI